MAGRSAKAHIANLFSEEEERSLSQNAPLAARMRPLSLEEYVGQEDVLGPDSWLRNAIINDSLSSIIFYGPAGTGKTTLARIIAGLSSAEFVEVSAVSGGVSDLRREIDAAQQRLLLNGRRSILFVDEIHRFSRSQQDALLHAVEDSVVILIGATTENPFFEVNTALLSRSRVLELHSLDDDKLLLLLQRALMDPRGFGGALGASRSALDAIVLTAGGDARMALTTLEMAAALAKPKDDVPADEAGVFNEDAPLFVTLSAVREASPRRSLPYDKDGDSHYDVISAFIKSMRGSDPDAAVYWLARMIDGGEDPRFIARRILILASEDIGNADPNALLVAHAAFKSAESIGYPECRINLAQAAIYMALAPKSNAAEAAIDAALAEVRKGPARSVPAHLRDRHRPGSEDYPSYLYPHLFPGAWVPQQYLPDGLEKGAFYHPSERGWEAYRIAAVARDRQQGENNPERS